MKHEYSLSDCLAKAGGDSYFYTFLDRPGMAAGVLRLSPGQHDVQEPHDSDEIYLVLSGDGFLRIKDRDYRLSRDKAYFVPKGTPHRFHSNTTDLAVLYFFGAPDP